MLPRKKLLRVALYQPYNREIVGWHYKNSIYASVVSDKYRWADTFAPYSGAFRPRIIIKLQDDILGTLVHFRIRTVSPLSIIVVHSYLFLISTITFG